MLENCSPTVYIGYDRRAIILSIQTTPWTIKRVTLFVAITPVFLSVYTFCTNGNIVVI